MGSPAHTEMCIPVFRLPHKTKNSFLGIIIKRFFGQDTIAQAGNADITGETCSTAFHIVNFPRRGNTSQELHGKGCGIVE
jgi:hypothetical protein